MVRSAGTTEYTYVKPFRRDTVNIGLAGDNITIRFVVSPLRVFSSWLSVRLSICYVSSRILQTDNPGPWFLHCHIDFRLVAGLATSRRGRA